jgi:nucleoside-diphosphate-sugar epimerase
MGKALRTYCYVSDAIELCFAAMISGKKEIYNIGGQSIISIAELAQKVAGQTKSVVIFPEKDIGSVKSAPANVSLNIDKILKISGKQDFIDINEGLSRTINWQRNNLYKTLSNEKN